MFWEPRAVLARIGPVQNTDGLHIAAVIDKRGCVVKNQHRRVGGADGSSIAGGTKVTLQNGLLTHTFIRKQPVGSFGICPILASPRDAAANAPGELFQHGLQSLAMPGIRKPASCQLLLDPLDTLCASICHCVTVVHAAVHHHAH
jgi:hypothetical protein